MKFLHVVVFTLLTSGLFAQESGFFSGARFAMGSSKFASPDFDREDNMEMNTKLLFAGGFNANYFFTESVGIATDVMLNFSGAKVNGTTDGTTGGIFGGGASGRDYTDKYTFVRLEVPVMGKISIPVGDFAFVAFAGPSIDFNLVGDVTRDYENGDTESTSIDDTETITTSFKAGGGIQVVNGAGKVFMLDARISNDLTPFYTDSENRDYKISYFALSIGVGF